MRSVWTWLAGLFGAKRRRPPASSPTILIVRASWGQDEQQHVVDEHGEARGADADEAVSEGVDALRRRRKRCP